LTPRCGSSSCARLAARSTCVRAALEQDGEVATTDVVVTEVLAGAGDDRDRDELRPLLYASTLIAVQGPADYERAAKLYRMCRANGETPCTLTDCLIAAVAIRNDVESLHADADFLVISRHAPLRLAPE
jgi:predicted nucleic acid-binding protein